MSEGQVTLHVRGVAHAGSLSIAKGVLDFKSGSGASLRLGLHQIARATADGERVCLVTHTCKLYLLVFPSGVVARRAEEALSREPAQPVLPPAAALPVADTHGHGWQLYHHATEHLRVFGAQLGTPKSPFRMSAVNAQYQVCSTYPFLLVVPAAVTDDALLACAKFRSRGRFAALTWRHPVTGATLSRCAQPLVGFSLGTSVRCDADEALIAALRKTQHANATLHIVDCRPAINAHANKVMGGGTENLAFYPGCTLEQLSLVNIHKVRDAFDALQLCCATAIKAEFGYVEAGVVVADDGRFLSMVDQSRWLNYITAILRGALRIASLLCARDGSGSGSPVLVHCSDGWDRTPQVCSLAQIILDPFFRTRRGFATLVCKEWLSFGHQFVTRVHGHDKKECSPVFLQFIDCVWQIARRFPHAFDFNVAFLLALVDHLYAGDTGTFAADSERQSVEMFAAHRFPSLWTVLLTGDDVETRKFGNPLYSAVDAPLWFKPSSWSTKLFESLFLRSI